MHRPPTVMCLTAALALIWAACLASRQADAGLEASEPRSLSSRSTPPAELLVRHPTYRDAPGGVRLCVHCLLKSGRRFDDGRLNRVYYERFKVKAVEPVFRSLHDEERLLRQRGVTVASTDLLDGVWEAKVRGVKGRFAARAARGAAPSPNLQHVYRVVFEDPATDLTEAARALVEAGAAWAHPNYPTRLAALPLDPFVQEDGAWAMSPAWGFEWLWGHKRIEVDRAWEFLAAQGKGPGQGVVVAVIDSGGDAAHQDLAGNVWVNHAERLDGQDNDDNGFIDDLRGWDFVEGDADPQDPLGHGTHVAGTVAAVAGNQVGIAGIAYQAQVMLVRHLDARGRGWLGAGVQALVYAVDNGADILNNSWGCEGGCAPADILHDVIEYADSLGAVVVWAAGNEDDDIDEQAPQRFSETITVAATDPQDRRSVWGPGLRASNFGFAVDVAAPGGGPPDAFAGVTPSHNILSLKAAGAALATPDLVVADRYLRLAGTSMATPHVSGVAALMLTANPDLATADLADLLRLSADDVAAAGFDPETGYGRVNAGAAVRLASEAPPRALPVVLRIHRASWSERSGNPNGLLEPGEVFDVAVYLINGRRAATQVTATLTSEGPLVTIPAEPVHVGAFAPREIKPATFRVSLDPAIAPGADVALRLAVSSEEGRQEFSWIAGPVVSPERRGWPVSASPSSLIYGAPAVADLDGDGRQEEIVAALSPPDARIVVFTADGQPSGVWPSDRKLESSLVAVEDVAGAGDLEVVAEDARLGRLHAFRYDGTELDRWPVEAAEMLVGRPVVADLDSDGSPEVLATALTLGGGGVNPGSYALCVWNGDGSPRSGWPVRFPMILWEMLSGDTFHGLAAQRAGPVSVADVDGDGDQEIVLTTLISLGHEGALVHAFDEAAGEIDGWPQFVPGAALAGEPRVADLDGDGQPEILVSLERWDSVRRVEDDDAAPSEFEIRIFRSDGSLWRTIPVQRNALSGPTVGDLDGDGDLELVQQYEEGPLGDPINRLAVLHHDGRPLGEWPIVTRAAVLKPILADVDGNGTIEVVGGEGDRVSAWRWDGRALTAGWPKRLLPTVAVSGLTVSDVDRDGRMDLVAGANVVEALTGQSASWIHLWDLGAPFDPAGIEWGTEAFNRQRVNAYARTPRVARNLAPRFGVIGTQELSAGLPWTLRIQAQDPEGRPLVYRASGLPPGASLNPTTGALSWQPTREQVGVSRDIRVEADDGEAVARRALTVVIFPDEGGLRLLSGGPIAVQDGQRVQVLVTALDRGRGPVRIEPAGRLPLYAGFAPLASGPGWAAALVSWTPIRQLGDYTIPIQATDGVSAVRSEFQITVGRQPPFVRGDAGGDASVDVSDAVFLLLWLFASGDSPPSAEAADANHDGRLDVSDAIYLLRFLFTGGPAPPAPFPRPGYDPTANPL